jgi:hypothetical protein
MHVHRDEEPSNVRAGLGVATRQPTQRDGLHMVALTIIIGGAVLIVLLIAGVRALRRASRQIDDIIREELDEPQDD